MEKIWKIAGKGADHSSSPEFILREFALRVAGDTDNMFKGLVTDTINEETGQIAYNLFLVVPELRNYRYRLIEVRVSALIDPYPVEVRLFAKETRNHQNRVCHTPEELKRELLDLITSPITTAILMQLQTMIEIKKGYQLNDLGV